MTPVLAARNEQRLNELSRELGGGSATHGSQVSGVYATVAAPPPPSPAWAERSASRTPRHVRT